MEVIYSSEKPNFVLIFLIDHNNAHKQALINFYLISLSVRFVK